MTLRFICIAEVSGATKVLAGPGTVLSEYSAACGMSDFVLMKSTCKLVERVRNGTCTCSAILGCVHLSEPAFPSADFLAA